MEIPLEIPPQKGACEDKFVDRLSQNMSDEEDGSKDKVFCSHAFALHTHFICALFRPLFSSPLSFAGHGGRLGNDSDLQLPKATVFR